MTALDIPTLIGFVGMACIIFAYAYMTGKADPNPFVQHGVNLAGAILLAISLYYHPNLPSMVLEGFWAAIAIWGIAKALKARRTA